MYSFLLHGNSKHKKAKIMNRNVVATISYNKYKDVLLNNKCIRHSMTIYLKNYLEQLFCQAITMLYQFFI